jgi:hypothetical protein
MCGIAGYLRVERPSLSASMAGLNDKVLGTASVAVPHPEKARR